MPLIHALYTHVVYPLAERANRGLARRLRQLRRQERCTLEENLALQWQSLRQLLRHADDTSPFYRERFRAAGFDVRALTGPEALRNLPALTRDDLRQHLSTIVSDRYPIDRMQRAASGGTTDAPVPLLRDYGGVARKRAVQEGFNAWAGMRPGDKVAWLWGARQDLPERPSWRWDLRERYLMRRVALPASIINAGVLEDYRLRLLRFRPRIIAAYPTPLFELCEYLQRSGQEYWRPQAVVATAEAVLPQQRSLISEVLGCPVFELYASREFGVIGGECEAHSGLHLNPSAAYVEYEPLDATAGESADVGGAHRLREILVTDLLNYGMPLIRYRINDCVGSEDGAATCACGRGYPLMPPILGRRSDVFQMPNGDRVPGIALTRLVLGIAPGLAKIQLIQESIEGFCLRYVARPGMGDADLGELRQSLERYFPAQVRFRFEPVSEIPREASGKTRPCICLLPQVPRGAGGTAGEGMQPTAVESGGGPG